MDLKEYLNCFNFYEPYVRPKRNPSQGDIIIPYKGLYKGPEEKLVGKNIIGIIVLTNKCDIEQNRAKYISFSPIYKANQISKATGQKKKKNWIKIIKQNHEYLFFIPPHPEIDPYFGGIIFYQDVRSEIKKSFFERYPIPTLTLKRPYIDRLCSKIAFFFNRIPIEQPEDEEIYNWIEGNIQENNSDENH